MQIGNIRSDLQQWRTQGAPKINTITATLGKGGVWTFTFWAGNKKIACVTPGAVHEENTKTTFQVHAWAKSLAHGYGLTLAKTWRCVVVGSK